MDKVRKKADRGGGALNPFIKGHLRPLPLESSNPCCPVYIGIYFAFYIRKRGATPMRNFQTVPALGAFREQRRIFHLISNNLSNAQTVGFKKDDLVFHTILNRSWDQLQASPTDEVKTLFHQGNVQRTGNELDLAIEGEGFFQIKTPYGMRYTRAGNFKLNNERQLVNAEGLPVMGKNGEIIISGQGIAVETDGTIKVDGGEVDQIVLVTFPDLDLLKKEGHNLFRLEVPQKEMEANDSRILQGALESSNVNPIEEMVNMIDSLRSYESCLKIVQSQDELDSKAVNDLGRV
jgi:flagellar basal-body rod protein FlgG